MRWTRETALTELRALAGEVDGLMGSAAGSAEHVRWIARVRSVLSGVFGSQSDFYQSFTALPWRRTGTFLVGGPANPADAMNPGAAISREHHRAFREQLDGARGLLLAAAEQIDRSGLPHHFGFRDRLLAAAQDGVADGLRIGLRNGTAAVIAFVVGILTGSLTPIGEWISRLFSGP